MRMKRLFPSLLFVSQFNVVDMKTGEIYFSRNFNVSKHSVPQKELARMKVVKVESEDNGAFTIWVKWYK